MNESHNTNLSLEQIITCQKDEPKQKSCIYGVDNELSDSNDLKNKYT